jgi:predicted phage tail protein
MAGGATAVATSLTAATTAVKVLATLDKIALFIALSGVSSLLTPDPPKEVASKESSSISTENTVTGVAVPLAYGEGYFDVLPISVEIASSGMMQGQYGNGGFDFNLINGGFKWTNPEYENPIV